MERARARLRRRSKRCMNFFEEKVVGNERTAPEKYPSCSRVQARGL